MSTKENRWSSILELYTAEKYDECQSLCETILNSEPNEYEKWFCVFRIALILKKRGQIKQAMKYAKSSLQYAKTDSHKTQVFWFLGCCYEKISLQQSIKYYRRVILNYEHLGMWSHSYTVRFNIAKMLKDFKEIETVIELLREEEKNNKTYDNSVMLNDTLKEAFDLYIDNNMLSEAINILRMVNNQNLREYMITAMRQSMVRRIV